MRNAASYLAGKLALICLLALSLTALSYAHDHHTASPDLAAYAAPDGTLPELCIVSGETTVTLAKCPACQIVVAAIVPEPDAHLYMLTWAVVSFDASATSIRNVAVVQAALARGPPKLA